MRCYDFPGPSTPVIATDEGFVAVTAESVQNLALGGTLLAFGMAHRRQLGVALDATLAAVEPVGDADEPVEYVSAAPGPDWDPED